jgi:DNA invertase Pin-like site-specific DNA recombinase
MTAAAIGYIRVSTTGQADDGVSLDAQRDRIAAWCLVNGHELAAVHVDAGISGKRSDNRPALQLALDEVCRRRGVLVVYSLSRLARSTKDTLSISERIEKAGADLVSLSEKIDTTSAAGKMVFRMLAVLAEFERDLVAERTSCAMQHKRHRGERVGSVPYGFDLAADGVQLVDNPAEQRVLKLVAELRAAGYTLRAIANELTDRGIETKGKGQAWSSSTIQRIVNRAA